MRDIGNVPASFRGTKRSAHNQVDELAEDCFAKLRNPPNDNADWVSPESATNDDRMKTEAGLKNK